MKLSANLITGLKLAVIYHLVLAAILAVFLYLNHPTSWSDVIARWDAWDGHTYAKLATEGYQTVGDQATYIVFFPLYPWLMRLTGLVIPNPYIAGVFITITTSIFGHAFFYALLLKKNLTHTTAKLAFLLFCLAPATIYFSLVCTEGLFLLLAVGCLYALEDRRYWIAALCGFGAAMTRVVGITLIIPYVFTCLAEHPRAFPIRKLLKGSVIPLGFGVYLMLNAWLFGNPFYYQQVLHNNWQKTIANPITRIIASAPNLLRLNSIQPPTYAVDIATTYVALAIVLVYVLVQRRKVWWSWTIWTLAMWLVIASQSFWLSNARYISLMLPLYVMLATILQKLRFATVLITLGMAALALYGIFVFAGDGWLY